VVKTFRGFLQVAIVFEVGILLECGSTLISGMEIGFQVLDNLPADCWEFPWYFVSVLGGPWVCIRGFVARDDTCLMMKLDYLIVMVS